MVKGIRKQVSIDKLKVRFDVNGREKDNYDIPSMKNQIVAAGRIIQPIIVEKMGDELVVLAGNRRTWAGQELWEDSHISVDLKEALAKTEVMLYEGLSEKERFEYIYDQGSQKQLGRTEVVKAVWRLSKEFFSEGEVINLLYFSLARYTGNERKLREVPSDNKAREVFLKKWLHGTVGNYILAAQKMGQYVQDQFILTHRAEDGLLKGEEKVEMRTSRERITQLSAAKSEDGTAWSTDKGGPKFNELIEQFKKEDAGTLSEAEKKKRPTVKDLMEKADVFKTPAIRKVLWIAAGETGDKVAGLMGDDDRLYREEQLTSMLARKFDTLKEPIKSFVTNFLNQEMKVDDFENWLASL